MYYAMIDRTVRPSNPGYGFANTKEARAFYTRQERDAYLKQREIFDFSAQPITRREAMRMSEFLPNCSDKGIYIGDTNDMVVMYSSSFGQYDVGDIVNG